jgi:hypothetical protein
MARKIRASKRKKSEPTLAEQLAALDKLRKLVRQIEADKAKRNVKSRQSTVRRKKSGISKVA